MHMVVNFLGMTGG
jgi:hypothetical protein